MQPRFNHPWDLSIEEAQRLQGELAAKLILEDAFSPPRLIAGADVSFSASTGLNYAGVVVVTYPELEVVEKAAAVQPATFPYVPGLLTFREGPALLSAFSRLRCEPDLLIFDGQGQAHPRSLGIAAHMGLLLDRPAIGCAKRRLCGWYRQPKDQPGSTSPLVFSGRTVGAVVRTRAGVKPVFVSPGHKISIDSAVAFVLSTCRGFRLPEVIRLAHTFVNHLRTQYH